MLVTLRVANYALSMNLYVILCGGNASVAFQSEFMSRISYGSNLAMFVVGNVWEVVRFRGLYVGLD